MSKLRESPFVTFLADTTVRIVIEFYTNLDVPIADFNEPHRLTFHVAFVSEDAEQDKERVVSKGSSFIEEVYEEDGSQSVMLRDFGECGYNFAAED